MKKFTAFCLALTFLLAALTACGRSAEGAPASSGAAVESSPEGIPSEISSGEQPSEKPNDPLPPKRETYGVVADDGVLRYRLVNGEFYEVYGIVDDGITDLTIPAKVGGKPVQRIKGAYQPSDIELTLDFDAIEYGAFSGCGKLASVKIPEGVTEIGDAAFAGCEGLLEVIIPESVTRIGDGAFCNCEGLREIAIPESVTYIGKNAFEGCKLLQKVTIPAGVQEIGEKVFLRCTALTEVTVAAGCTAYKSADGVLYTADGEKLLCYPAGKKDTVYRIPEGMKTIPAETFDGCDTLREILLPESLETIESVAFGGCTALETIRIPKNVKEISPFAFVGCRSLAAVEVDAANTAYKSADGVLFTGDGEELMLYPIAKPGEEYTIPAGVKTVVGFERYVEKEGEPLPQDGLKRLVLPKSLEAIYCVFPQTLEEFVMAEDGGRYRTVDGVLYGDGGESLAEYPMAKPDAQFRIPNGVKSIETYVLKYNPHLKTVYLPASLENIDDVEFSNPFSPPALEAFEVAEENAVYKAVDGVLYDKSGETLLSYPSAKPEAAFAIPEGVKTVPESAGIASNSHLKRISLPASLGMIDCYQYRWFFGDSLEEIEVAEGNKYYSSADGLLLNRRGTSLLFYPVSKPDSDVTLPEGLVAIDEHALWSPQYLKTLRLPASLQGIAELGIMGVTLEAVYIPAGVSAVGGNGVLVPFGATVYCEAKEQPTDWSEYWCGYNVNLEDTRPHVDEAVPVVWGDPE